MKYGRTKYGNLMYGFCMRSAVFLFRHSFFYYLLNWTWGFIVTFIGMIIGLIMLILLRRPIKFQRIHYFMIGRFWGGFSVGQIFIRDEKSDHSIDWHEYGHTYQNAVLGPFFIFLVCLPSVIRYWIYTIKTSKGRPVKDYDAIWFEGNATDIGAKIMRNEM
jgi:hypothetical protein